jgi:S-adenosylmethionine decarboxylase
VDITQTQEIREAGSSVPAEPSHRKPGRAAGIHAIIELYDCPYALLDSEEYVRTALRQAARAAKLRLLKLTSHRFSPHGVTALGLLAESHISIHTWPETGYGAADLFTCGNPESAEAATQFLVSWFEAKRYTTEVILRGVRPGTEHQASI